jgi:hypothetical protein
VLYFYEKIKTENNIKISVNIYGSWTKDQGVMSDSVNCS